MDEETSAKYSIFLRQIFLFSSLSDFQIDDLIPSMEVVECKENQVIFNEGDPGNYFYLVYRGRVKINQIGPDGDKVLGVFGAGEYFGENALLLNQPRSATAIAIEPGTIFLFRKELFDLLLHDYSTFRANLIAVVESRKLSQRAKFKWLGKDEVIYLIARKHEFFLYRSLVIPILIGLLVIPIFIYGIGTQSSFLHTISLGGAAFLLAVAVLGSIWNYVDWGNDYYVVTNQRVVWIERVVGLYNSRREAPLATILAVNLTSSQTGRLLKYGDVDVRTFTGSILMHNMAQPNLFSSFVKGHQVIAQQHLKEAELKAMRLALRQGLGLSVDETLPTVNQLAKSPVEKPYQKTQTGNWKEKFETFFQVRYEKGGIVTYRKHWLILVRKIGIPSLVIFVLTFFSIFLGWQLFSGKSYLFQFPIWLVILLVFYAIAMLWWGYQYLDWSNDIYRLTPDQILDIEKKPLGREDKKTAPLDSILSIEHARNGIIELLFNFGQVVINVGQTQFIFHGVYNPDQVHQDVADYMEARRRKKREIETQNEKERMVNWLKTYHDQPEILEDSDKENSEENISG
jgi:hypothetical protein